mgnify:FL=1|jgi:hypothetical protein
MARKFLVSIDLNKNELLNARIQNLGSAPSNPVIGQIYYNSGDNVMYYYNGLASPNGPWQSMSGSQEVIQDAIGASIEGGVGLTKTYVDSTGITTIDLDNTAVTTGSYGSQTKIPTFTVDQQGRLTAAGEVDVATELSITGDTGTTAISLLTEGLTVNGGEGIDVAVTNNAITISAEDASTTNKGVASFDAADFNVNAGVVSVKDINLDSQTTGDYVATIVGTANEVTVSPNSGHNAAVTIGLPDNVEITGNLQVGGNLNVIGTVNSVNTTQINIEDNKVKLNSNFTGTPTTDAGLTVERGTETDVEILWNETSDTWTLTNNGTSYHAIARKYAETLGASATSYTITHNLGTTDVTVQIFEAAIPFAQVEADVQRSAANSVTINFASAPAAGEYRVVVVG